jgi:putative DNA primase/helicase
MPEWLRALAEGPQHGPSTGPGSAPGRDTVVTDAQVEELRDALKALNADLYDVWIAMGHALHELGAVGFGLWDEWGQASGKYDAAVARQKWGTFAGERTGYRAVFAAAQRAGWVNPMAGGGERAGPATDAADPGLLSEREAETLLAWAWHTGATLPSADDSGIFLGPKNPQTGKASERLRVKVRLSSDHTAPWIKIAWGSGPDSFMAEVDRYIPRREELVDQENLRRMERSAKPQEDISSADLRSHAVAWLARVRGLAVSDEVGRALFERVGGSCGIWPEPQPITAKIAPEPYPLDALPLAVRAAVEEVAGFVKAPIPLVVSSALAALSLAIQAHADAKRAEKLHGPTGLFLLTIADSGERKSTCDGFFTQAIREYEAAKAEADKPLLKDHAAAIGAWEAKRAGVKEKIRQLAKEGKSAESMERDLRDLEHGEPAPPRIPRLLYADATPEALAYGLSKQWPSAGVVSAEAGIVFGSHGMGKDSVMRNLGLLNQLWDGATLTIDRRSTESFTVRGARLTVALQVQEPTLREFFNRSGALARGSGFLARFLVAWPESTQGHRPFTEAPANWPHLAAFHQRITAILAQPAPIDEDGALTPPMLSLTPEAKALWVAYHDAIERELSSGGELYDVRDVASKSADNAVRLAALFQVFEGAGGAIGAEAFDGASRITAWHLNEARRFFGELALPAELADAARLDSWLIDHCQQKLEHTIGKSVALQYGPLRKKESLDAAIRELAELDRVRVVKDGKRLTLTLNPALLGFANAKAANPANDGGMDP